MTRDWREHPAARDEFFEAHRRYLEIADGRLAREFVDTVEQAAELILQWPDAPPPYLGRRREPMIRTWHLGKFPYNVIYTVHAGEVLVLAYASESRKPGYWIYRLDEP